MFVHWNEVSTGKKLCLVVFEQQFRYRFEINKIVLMLVHLQKVRFHRLSDYLSIFSILRALKLSKVCIETNTNSD